MTAETIEKVSVYLDEREILVPVGEHSTDHLHALLVVGEDQVLVLLKDGRELFLDEIETIEIIGGERFGKRHRHHHLIKAKVNRVEVEFAHAKVTGLAVKEHAIKKGVAIKTDFPLFKNEDGGRKEPVADGQTVRLLRHPETSFTCVAPDDNS
jgi:hypothetical protein